MELVQNSTFIQKQGQRQAMHQVCWGGSCIFMWHSESFDSSLTRQTFVLQRLWKKRSRKLLSQDVYFSQPMLSCRKRNLVLVTFPQSHYVFIQQLFHLKCIKSTCSKPDIYLCISVMCLLSCAGGICLPRDRKIGKP